MSRDNSVFECKWLLIALIIVIGFVCLVSSPIDIYINSVNGIIGIIINTSINESYGKYYGIVDIKYNIIIESRILQLICDLQTIQSKNDTYIEEYLEANYKINDSIIIYPDNDKCYLSARQLGGSINYVLLYTGICFMSVGILCAFYMYYNKNTLRINPNNKQTNI